MGELKILSARGGVTFGVRVIPRAKKNEIVGVQEGELRIRLTAPPVEGAANKALVDFLAQELDVRRRQVEIISGMKSRSKVVRISDISPAEVRRRLAS
ncbi:MAG: YggU family protein [Anaerolineae bacterium]|nr:YggU family protein [Anaerolineae bacterium]